MNRLLVGCSMLCCLALQPVSASANGEPEADGNPPVILWIATKTTYGYDNRFLKYPSMSACNEAMTEEKSRASADTELWCAAAPPGR